MLKSPIINTSIIKALTQSSDRFFQKSLYPKKKYGSPQIDDNNSCRLREVTKPVYFLKELQKVVKVYLEDFDLPDCMHGGVVGRNNISNAIKHINNRYFFTIDLKNFFGTISNSRVHQAIIGLGLTWKAARNITRIATVDGCLPQGAPTSSILANIVFSPIALLLEDFCKQKDITFTIFVDDLTFSSANCFKRQTGQIIKILQANRFVINHKKVHYKINTCEITGLIVGEGQLKLPKAIIKNIKKPGVKQYVEYFKKRYDEYLFQKNAALVS